MNNYTKGPWKFTADADGNKFHLTDDDITIVGGCGCCGSPWVSNLNDAFLIAAAPDLLEALEIMVENFGPTPSDAIHGLGSARAALVKARWKA